MTQTMALIRRNAKLFFKDKGMFFTAMITPGILLVLYATFLGNIYRDSFQQGLPEFVKLSEELLDGLVGGQLISSLLAVSCITVAFCSNILMVQDKANGSIKDLRITPVKTSALSAGYYIASLISTLLVCFVAAGLCLIYVAVTGWYMTAADVALLFLDVVILSLFGTALSSVIHFFLSTQGQIAAVGSIVSAGYGFICGAYMPIDTFSEGLQKAVSFLPGTYGTSLVRHHAMRGAFQQMLDEGAPKELVRGIQESLDFYPELLGKEVSVGGMYAILGGSVVVLMGIFLLQNLSKKKA